MIHGTPHRDVIWGGGGDDVIFGSLGNDLICGGPGSDLIDGGRGNDELDGGVGDADRVSGDLGDDKVLGGAGNGDEVAGDLGIDIVNGGPGDEDLVHGDYGWDRMSGGAGKAASPPSDQGRRWQGRRRLDLAQGPGPSRDGDGHDKALRLRAIEGSAFRDTRSATRQAQRDLRLGPVIDDCSAAAGADTLIGGQGSDGCGGERANRVLRQRKAAERVGLRATRPRRRRCRPAGGSAAPVPTTPRLPSTNRAGPSWSGPPGRWRSAPAASIPTRDHTRSAA